MGLKAIARMIQTMLYGRRFFPYFAYIIIGGIEEDGELSLTQYLQRKCSYVVQALARSTLSTLLVVMREKHVELPAPLNP
jgi:hypothetical protein